MSPPQETRSSGGPALSARPDLGDGSGEKLARKLRARVVQTRLRIEGTRRKVEETAPRIPALDAGLKSVRTDRAVGGSLLAGAVAFRLFLWLVPVSLVLVGGLGIAARSGTTDASTLNDRLGLSRYIAESIAANSSAGSVVAFVIGAFALWWAGIGAFKALRTIHQLAWRLPVTPTRGAWKGGLCFTGATLGSFLLAALVSRIRADAPGVGLAYTLLLVLLWAGVWFAASLALPHADAPPKALIPGALLFAIGIQVLHLATVLYFARRIAHASEVYGPLGIAIGLLVWLYVIGRVAVAAPVLNATLLARQPEEQGPGTARPDGRRSR